MMSDRDRTALGTNKLGVHGKVSCSLGLDCLMDSNHPGLVVLEVYAAHDPGLRPPIELESVCIEMIPSDFGEGTCSQQRFESGTSSG
jgi:hypothetical protein